MRKTEVLLAHFRLRLIDRSGLTEVRVIRCWTLEGEEVEAGDERSAFDRAPVFCGSICLLRLHLTGVEARVCVSLIYINIPLFLC